MFHVPQFINNFFESFLDMQVITGLCLGIDGVSKAKFVDLVIDTRLWWLCFQLNKWIVAVEIGEKVRVMLTNDLHIDSFTWTFNW